MNRPSTLNYLVGNPLSVLALLTASGLVLWQWWQDALPLPWGLGALLVVGTTLRASDRIAHYARWKREWDAMAGIAPSPPLLRRIGQIPGLRGLVLICLWSAAVYWQSHAAADMPTKTGLALIIAGLPVLLGLQILLRLHRWLHRRRTATARLAPVALCLRRPWRSASRAAAEKALPDYCKSMLSGNT